MNLRINVMIFWCSDELVVTTTNSNYQRLGG